MPLRLLAIALLLAVPFAVGAQTPANPDPTKPDFTMLVEGTFDPETLAEFNRQGPGLCRLTQPPRGGIATPRADDQP